VAGVITPPDVISQLVVSFPLLILYEVSIWLSARVKKQEVAVVEEWS
jgi:sec-independent protein translocase protein TatC